MNEITNIDTLLEQPLIALYLMNLCDSGRITHDLFIEALASPKLAQMVVRHEALHDYYDRNRHR